VSSGTEGQLLQIRHGLRPAIDRGETWQRKRNHQARSSQGRAKVHKVMKEKKEGTLKSGSGKKVKSRKQAVAIALNEAKIGRKDT
jgi:hypothetical protein